MSGSLFRLGTVAGGILCLFGAHVFGSFTPIGTPPVGEPNQAEILSTVYGGTFVANGLDFSNGTLTATRIDDANDTGGSTATLPGKPSGRIIARFGTIPVGLGYQGSGSAVKLVDAKGTGYNASGSFSNVDLPNPFTGVLFVNGQAAFSSDPEANSDGQDHLITYLLTGKSVPTAVVGFWEDKTVRATADFDFNDLVFEAKFKPIVVPLSSGVWSGLIALSGCVAVVLHNRRLQKI